MYPDKTAMNSTAMKMMTRVTRVITLRRTVDRETVQSEK